MITIDKRYTIRYSKAGIRQFADFNYSKDAFISHSFRPSWVKQDELPSFEGIEHIEDFLRIIKKWSYANQAEIILINGNPPNYNSQDVIKKCEIEFREYFNCFCLKVFTSEILPILKRKRWKIGESWMGRNVLIRKIKGEWDNVDSNDKDSILIDFICNRFLNNVLNLDIKLDFRNEHGYVSGDSFPMFIGWIEEKELIKLNIFLKNNDLLPSGAGSITV